MHKNIPIALAAIVLGTLLFGALPVFAQDGQAQRYTFDFRGMPLGEALQHLATTTGVGLVYDPTLVAHQQTSCVARNQLVEVILHCLLEETELDLERLPTVTYVIRQRPDQGAAPEPPAPITQPVQYGSINGAIFEKETGAPLIGAHVIVAGLFTGAAAGQDGHFVIPRVPVGTYALEGSMIGFETAQLAQVVVRADRATEITLALEQAPISIGEIIVTPGYFSMMQHRPVARQTLTRTEIRDMPHIADDIYRTVTRLPGVTGNDIFAGFTVRGGSHEEVLVQLDGMELYEPFHIKSSFGGGLMSIIDSETVGGMELMTGAFPVEYGNRLSGVFNIESSRPRDKKTRTSLGMSFTNARLLSEGSFQQGRGEWLVVARRGYVDLLLTLAKEDEVQLSYYDVFGKLRYRLNDKHTLALHVLQAKDDVGWADPDPLNQDIGRWRDGASYGWLTWTATPHPRLMAQTVLSAGALDQRRNATFFSNGTGRLWSVVADDRNADHYGLKQDWTLDLSDRLLLKAGASFRHFKAGYDYFHQQRTSQQIIDGVWVLAFDTTQTRLQPSGNQMSAYVSGRFRPWRALTVEGGLRYDEAGWTDDQRWSPRLNLAYALGKKTTLRLGWGRFTQTQGIHQVRVEDGDNAFYPSEVAEHRVAGLEHLLGKGLTLRVEAYQKKLSDLRPRYQNLLDGALDNQRFPEVEEDRIRLEPSHGTAKGIEFFVKKQNGNRFNWWASYSLAIAEDYVAQVVLPTHFEGVVAAENIAGTMVLRPFDQRHTFYADAGYWLNEKWGFNLAFQFHSGWPYTLSTQQPDLRLLNFGTINSERAAPYHRLDARISRHFTFSKSRLTTFVEFVNLLDVNNLRRATEQITTGPDGEPVVQRVEKHWTTLVPSFGLRWDIFH